MQFQPLYSLDDRRAAVERAKPLDVAQGSGSCTRCPSRFSARTVCMQPDIIQGDTAMGALLVVGERPSAASDRSGIAHDDDAGEWVRQLVSKSWRGRILYDYAVRCYAPGGLGKKGGGNKKALAETVSACRGYLHGVVREHQPARVLALGPLAFASLLGRVPPAESVRQSYAYLSDGTPVFLLMPPAVAIRNRFQARWFAEDVAWSCTTPVAAPTQWDAEVISVRTHADSELACAQLRAAKWFSFDTETSGVFGDHYFRVLALAACPGSGDSAFVWDEAALLDPEIAAPLLELLADPTVKKAGHNVKYDIMAISTAFGVDVQGLWCDSMLDRSALQADAKVGLDIVAELVGMGGLKRALTKAIQDGVDAIGAARTRAKKLAKTGCREELSLPGLGDPCIEAAVRLIDVEPRRFAYAMVPAKLLTRYVARDAVSTAKIVELQRIGAVGATRETKPEDVDRPRHSLRWSVLRHPADQMLTPAAYAYAQIEKWGIAASRPAMLHFNAFLRQGLDQVLRRLDTEGLKNPNSNAQIAEFLFKKRGLTPGSRFGESVAADHLADLIHRYPSEATLIQAILESRRLGKLLGTYAEGYIVHIRSDGRIHPTFKITGARTGRPSCLAGWSPVVTRRGEIPIQDVRVGDEVWTHQLRWRCVLNQWLVGTEETVDLQLSNGVMLTCTSSHRLLASDGRWRFVHECIKALGLRTRESAGGVDVVSGSQQAVDDGTDQQGVGDHGSQCLPRTPTTHAEGGAQGGKGGSLCCVENRGQEPDEGEGGRAASELEGSMQRRVRLSDVPVQRQEGACSSDRYDGGSWSFISAGDAGSPPYRREQEEQRPGQPCPGDSRRASDDSCISEACGVFVEAIFPRGRTPVFDLTVDEDESFACGGIFSHNCEDPNMQILPRTGTVEGRMSRDCFQVAPGRMLIELDFSQIEIRTAAGLSNDQVMLEAFHEGARSLAAGGKDVDLHWRTVRIICQAAWGIDPATLDLLEAKTAQDKANRSASKAITFGKMYGKQNRTLARELGISVEAADAIDTAILGGYRGFADWCDQQLALGRKYGESWTWWQGKRFRRRPLWEIGDAPVGDRKTSRCITAENSTKNTPIQGTASDFCLASAIEVVDAAKRGHLGKNTQVPLTIHDALLLECDEDLVPIVVPKAKALMLQWPTPGNVPFGVDAKVGRSFGSMKEYHA